MKIWHLEALAVLAAASALAAHASPARPQAMESLHKACIGSADAVGAPSLELSPAEGGTLSGITVANRTTGARFTVRYDPDSRDLAERCLPFLDAVYTEVARLVGADPAQVGWHDVSFSATDDHFSPGRARWVVVTDGGDPTAAGQRMLARVLPHEQVHAAQASATARSTMPRWFREGQASWIEHRLTAAYSPDLAQEQLVSADRVVAGHPQRAPLASWGKTQVSGDSSVMSVTGGGASGSSGSTLRVVGQNPRLGLDTGAAAAAMIPGQGQITMETSDSAAVAREAVNYAAALTLMRGVEQAAGLEALTRWFQAVHRAPGPLDSPAMIDLAREHTQQDISSWLGPDVGV